jgi:hypothetical protein
MLYREHGILLDFHGFYEESMEDEIYSLLSDMLTVGDPHVITAIETAPTTDPIEDDTPPFLVNRAWNVCHSRAEEYASWEKQAVITYLSGDDVHR